MQIPVKHQEHEELTRRAFFVSTNGVLGEKLSSNQDREALNERSIVFHLHAQISSVKKQRQLPSAPREIKPKMLLQYFHSKFSSRLTNFDNMLNCYSKELLSQAEHALLRYKTSIYLGATVIFVQLFLNFSILRYNEEEKIANDGTSKISFSTAPTAS
jgi:hypothetical protein